MRGAAPKQLPLDLGCRPALGAADFVIAPSNADAVAWLDRWPDWPGGGLAIHGPRGCGKTHLAHVWRARSRARLLDAGALDPDRAGSAAGRRAVVVEGADRGVDERALLRLYNALVENRGFLMLTGGAPPARWPIALPDLRSRLAALPAVAVAPPDDALLAAVLVKQLSDRQLRVPGPVVDYLVAHMERSFAAAGELVIALDRAALDAHRNITVALAREVLKGLEAGRAVADNADDES